MTNLKQLMISNFFGQINLALLPPTLKILIHSVPQEDLRGSTHHIKYFEKLVVPYCDDFLKFYGEKIGTLCVPRIAGVGIEELQLTKLMITSTL